MNTNNQFKINENEKKVYSQNGEDGIIDYIFSNIGTTNKFSVEFGVGDGFESNTAYLLEKKNWSGLMMDYGSDDKKIVKKEKVEEKKKEEPKKTEKKPKEKKEVDKSAKTKD